MKDFFQDKFEYDFFASKNWIESLESQEDFVSEFTIRSMSHILNAHHIWNRRLLDKPLESELWDVFPIHFLQKLLEENYRETIEYLEKVERIEKIKYHSSEGVAFEKSTTDVLYYILNHSNYHRAQIALDLKQNKLKTPNFNFISYH
jgi:uncharacterized damage-inducible protein DinB